MAATVDREEDRCRTEPRSRSFRAIEDYYEELWRNLPDDLCPQDFELRRDFLRSAVRGGERALDLGCGQGEFTAELAAAGTQAVGVDVARAALQRAARRHPDLAFRPVAITGKLPFADGGFELVWASEVIEHVADTARWLSEVRRVLVPGGRLLLTTPNHPRARLLVHGLERYSEPLGDHLHLYTRRSLRATLLGLGFDRVEVRAAVGPPLFRRLLLARALRA